MARQAACLDGGGKGFGRIVDCQRHRVYRLRICEHRSRLPIRGALGRHLAIHLEHPVLNPQRRLSSANRDFRIGIVAKLHDRRQRHDSIAGLCRRVRVVRDRGDTSPSICSWLVALRLYGIRRIGRVLIISAIISDTCKGKRCPTRILNLKRFKNIKRDINVAANSYLYIIIQARSLTRRNDRRLDVSFIRAPPGNHQRNSAVGD